MTAATVGEVVTATRRVTQECFDRFAKLSGDDNPIHVDPGYAATTPFGGTVAHGMLLYSLVCAALRQRFPAAQSVEQRLMFPKPTSAGEQATVRAQVVAVTPPTVELDITVERGDGETVCTGTSVLRTGGAR